MLETDWVSIFCGNPNLLEMMVVVGEAVGGWMICVRREGDGGSEVGGGLVRVVAFLSFTFSRKMVSF